MVITCLTALHNPFRRAILGSPGFFKRQALHTYTTKCQVMWRTLILLFYLSGVASPICGGQRERPLPFLPNFSLFPNFPLLFPDFWQFFRCQGGPQVATPLFYLHHAWPVIFSPYCHTQNWRNKLCENELKDALLDNLVHFQPKLMILVQVVSG